MHEDNMARRMARAMHDIEFQIPQRDDIVMLQPAVRREAAAGGKAVLLRRVRHAVDPELVVAMRPFDGQLELLGDLHHRTGMIEMAMGARSERRRYGKEVVGTGSSGWSTTH